MKSLRRSVILIIFLLVSVASMATGVFAWFIDYGNRASVGPISGETISNNDILVINAAENDEIFLGDRVRNLVYLTTEDFNYKVNDFYGYSSLLHFDIQNNSDTKTTAVLSINAVAAPEFGDYAGTNSSLKYLILTNHPTLSQSAYLTQRMNTFQESGNIFNAMNAHNQIGVTIPAGETVNVHIYVWGYYDGLPEAQKAIYHALVYRVKVMV